jgi:PAS domain S-box-containing protein
MSDRILYFWLYPKPTGDIGRDRNAHTLQLACFLFTLTFGFFEILDLIAGERAELPQLSISVVGLIVAAVLNRAGRSLWAARLAVVSMMLTTIWLVVDAKDGFRSLSMLMFPGLLLLSVMLLDRASYLTVAGIVLLAVASLGIAERHGLTRAVPGVRSLTTFESIFYVDLFLLGYATIGSRIARDAQNNVADLRRSISEFSTANIDLKATAEALRESEQRLFSIYNTVRDVVFHLAVEAEGQFRFLSVNARFLEVTGLSQETVLGKTVNEVIPEPALPIVLGKYREAVEKKTMVSWEETSEYPTGQLTGEVSISPVFDDKGVCTHLVGSVHDITERKRAEAALRESELRYREIFDSFSECIFVLDVTPDGRFRIAGFNPAEEKATGLSSSEVAGKFIDDVLEEDTAQLAIAHYQRCLEVGTVIHYEEDLNLPIGVRHFHTNLIPLRNDAGCIHRIVGCCLDFTDLKRAQEEALARQKLESVGTLAGGIAHDFNNLLGAVQSQAELAIAELDAGSSCRESLKAITAVTTRGSEIVRQLMIYAGKECEPVESADLSTVAEEMLGLLKVSVSKHAVIDADLSHNIPATRASAAQIRQILMNLITNASDAIGDRDGMIRVVTRPVALKGEAATNSSTTLPGGDYAELEVADSGRGMSAETQARLFDPFFSTKSAGRGLGLAVVQGIVRSLGGAIRFTSEPDRGTTFQVLLPCTDTPAGGGGLDAPDIRQLAVTSRGTVLVVEDEHTLRQAVTKMLRRVGLEVFEAADGTSAIDLLRANGREIDAILLDMTLPGASSREIVAEALRANRNVKVILTSAYSQETIAEAMSAPQIRSFIRKPFQFGDLMKALQRSLSA